jgi:hypothetical protein
MRTKYFDSTGNEIEESVALNRHGILKDGCTIHVSMQMRDAALSDHAFRRPRVTDGTDNPFALNRPGWRMRVGDNRQAIKDALAEYEAELTNRWRDGDSSGENHYSETRTHHGADSSTRHRQVDRAYQEYDRQLVNAWRQP